MGRQARAFLSAHHRIGSSDQSRTDSPRNGRTGAVTTCRTCARYNRDCPLDEGAEVCGQYINKERDDIMDWLNLHISTIDSPEATVCDPVRRATWVWLLRFCIGQENGGRIKGCRAWGDTTWQQMAKVRLREVSAESTLWHWDGDDLEVHFYPADKEAEVQAKRANGRRGGRPRNHMDNHMVSDSETTRFDSAETEGKGKEGERKGSTPAAAAAVVPRANPGGDGARSVIAGFDSNRIRKAVDESNALGVIGAFGGARDCARDAEWGRDAAGMSIGGLVTVFWLAQNDGDAIRQPSGLRSKRAEWDSLPTDERRICLRAAFDALGIPLPAAKSKDNP